MLVVINGKYDPSIKGYLKIEFNIANRGFALCYYPIIFKGLTGLLPWFNDPLSDCPPFLPDL
jgi:hypothetical protein